MADIIGTPGNDPALNGTGDADTITALAGNDVVNAGAGNDTIFGGLGNDTLNGDDGDDLFIEDEFTNATDIFNGGSGIDTIELRAATSAFQSNIGLLTAHNFTGANSLSSIERLVFAGPAGQAVVGQVTYAYATSGALTEIVGGAGRDFLSLGGGTVGATYTMPNLNLVGWDALPVNAWQYSGDSVSLTGSSLDDTVNALQGASFFQLLIGGQGNDTINGSGNADFINATVGADTVNAGGGNDAIAIINQRNPTGSSWLPPTTFSGGGGVWDGGSGTDVITIGGEVNLQATLLNIEGVNLLPAFQTNLPFIAQQDAAILILDSAHIAMLPSNAFFTGIGTVVFQPAAGASLNTSTYSITAGSTVSFTIEAGDGNGLTFTGNSGNDTIELGVGSQSALGGNGDDRIQFGAGSQTATGGAGADRFGPGQIDGVVTDFTIGQDKIDLTGSEIFNQSRLFDLLSQSVNGAMISAQTIDGYFQMTLQGVSLASLTVSDFLLGVDDGFGSTETGTSAAEYFFGTSGNDEFHGGDGSDRFYNGGGIDKIFGDGGDDTIVIDGAFNFGVTFDGGSGTDTLLLRQNAASVANGPATQYFVFPGAPGTGLVSVERISFESSASYALTFVTTTAPGIAEAIGGAGADLLVLVATSAGTYSMPVFALSNWSSNDGVGMVAQTGTSFNVTFNGRNDIGQFLIGQGGNDTLNGGALADLLRGGAGGDTLNGGGGADGLNGEAGNDRLVVGNNGVSVDGGTEIDTLAITGTVNSFAALTGMEAIDLVGGASLTLTGAQVSSSFVLNTTVTGTGSLTIDMTAGLLLPTKLWSIAPGIAVTINGTSGTDIMKLGNVVQTVNGGDGQDQIKGGSQVDTINGGAGIDKIMGLGGADILTGGAGNDVFRYLAQGDSGIGVGADKITDFTIGQDKLNFKDIDADAVTAGDQAFAFLGNAAFSSPGTGQIRYQDSGADLLVQVDVNGDGTADMEVILQGLSGQALAAGSFVL
jgi:Ca2+-binding RTX toxin-like protein